MVKRKNSLSQETKVTRITDTIDPNKSIVIQMQKASMAQTQTNQSSNSNNTIKSHMNFPVIVNEIKLQPK